jgi:hypothetical protein
MSALAVGIVTLAALLLGAVLKSSVENRSQHIERKGVSAALPANWVVNEGAGNLILVSWDPFVPDVRYSVSLESNDGDHPLAEVAKQRNTILGKVLEAFRILDETPIIRRGREGYKVTYAYVDTKVSGLPLVLQGVDYYFPEAGKAMVITLQAQEGDYEEALLRFEAFLDSVSYKAGG